MRSFFVVAAFFLFSWYGTAEAARQFTAVQTSPAAPAAFDMGTTQSVTFTVTNTNTGWNSGERIYQMRFRINTGTTFSASTVAPAGWTRTAFSTTSVIFQANSWANAIITGSSVAFTLVLNLRSATADVTESLLDARANYTNDTNFANGINRTGRTTVNNPGSWTLKSLSMTLVPSTFNVGAGCQFTLTMTVTNRSTSNLTGVTSVPKPPTRTGVNATTTSNPPNLNLNAGATGTMVWTYTAGVTAGTLTFTAYAQDSTATRKSSSVTTPAITVTTGASCTFTAAIANTGCIFTGDTATFAMMVTNTTGGALTNIVPSALSKFVTGTAAIGAFTGPVPASIASLANNASGTFTWTAPVTGNINDTYYVTGFATANGPIQTALATSNTQSIKGYTITTVPASTNAGSANEEIMWTVTNAACADIDHVSIAAPGGWTFAADGYAVVSNTVGSQVDTWTLAGTTFSSPNATDRIPLAGTGDFSLLYSFTPAAAGLNTFTITVTDATGMSRTVQSVVLVNPFNTGGLNATSTGIWQEEVR